MKQRARTVPFTLPCMTDAAAHAAANAEQLRVLREALDAALLPFSGSAPSALQYPVSSPTGQEGTCSSTLDQGNTSRGIPPQVQALPAKKTQP